MPYHSITFSIPESKIVSACPEKKKFKAGIVAGDSSTYVYHREEDYYKDYQESYFAVTKHKGGWDCLRHYEILGNGCIPYFISMENMPITTMTMFPKDILLETNRLYEEMLQDPEKQTNEFYTQQCKKHIDNLLFHTRLYLSSTAVADSILERSGHSHIKSILFLSGSTYQDYLRCLVLGAFKKRFGTQCHDYPIIPHIYDDFTGHDGMGACKGFTFTNVVPRSTHDDSLDNSINEDVVYKRYDLVIYGSLHRGLPMHDLVTTYYSPHEIIYLCGEDICRHNACESTVIKERIHPQSNIFVRELYSLQYYLVHQKDGNRCRHMIHEIKKGGLDALDASRIRWFIYEKEDNRSRLYQHYLCFKDIVERNKDFGVIMDDTIQLDSNIQETLRWYIQQLNEKYPGWDLIFPDHQREIDVQRVDKGDTNYHNFNSIYIIHRKCAIQLYRLFRDGEFSFQHVDLQCYKV